jgi:RHS repeat-associated protein
MGYTNSPTDYANPDAVTQIANGLSTTTFTVDNNGNVTQKTVDGTTTTYVYDYANRLTALGAGGATTTYGYDAFGQRGIQTGTTTTTLYPFKWYSVASSTGTGAKYATTTDYVFNGDTMLSTVDQQTASGVATGTAKTCYTHPDHLGSTNVVTDENDNVVQTLDYYPYGGTRISTNSGTNEQRKNIGQFADQSGLDYLNARYYDSSRGQFTTQDPVFLGTPKEQDLTNPQGLNSPRTMSGVNSAFTSAWSGNIQSRNTLTFSSPEYLIDPQQQNSYSYGRDNPVSYSDPSGRFIFVAIPIILTVYGVAMVSVDLYDAYNMNIKYASVTTPAEKNETRFKIGFDAVTSIAGMGAARVGMGVYGLALGSLQATGDVMDQYFGRQIYQNVNYSQIQSQTSAQSRQQAVQTYNTRFGLSTGGGSTGGGGVLAPNANSLWVTPSGAVVTWGGQLVAAPTNKK